jgi:predicted protein tyrosine phosphatase
LAVSNPSGFAPFSLTVCGIEELAGHCEVGVSHVLSILDPGYPSPPAFGSFGEHERLELRFNDIIDERADAIAPRREDIETLLLFGRSLLRESPSNAHLLVHCHAGVSRSTAAMALILAQSRPDRPAAHALAEVVRIRPQAWPNLRMIELGDALLGRGGEIVAAVRRHYRIAAFRRPELVPAMIAAGRSREVIDLATG